MKRNNELYYPIGIVAEMFNVSVGTIRAYEKEGLILPRKTEGKHRYFNQNDITRIACIRRMITEKGLNIAGIKMVFSIIPCWEVKQCSQEDRTHCPAYHNADAPCWEIKNENSVCGPLDCRDCPVYIDMHNCDDLKATLKRFYAVRENLPGD
ncbi:MAG TPA: MerR family transcriptional regulator [Caldithrix abyssi]|uniref:MerR family transcriptional regulator n=1 Tax=Caldithrix abyssi TaxID=187145 RepID=A0A7V1LK97_CALAY|nr:MerR family transcriptional regulator [Caldithrix abyssi]